MSAEELQSVSVNVTRGTVTVVHTKPDTAYNVTCLGYDNQERDLCREQKMSIITRECRKPNNITRPSTLNALPKPAVHVELLHMFKISLMKAAV